MFSSIIRDTIPFLVVNSRGDGEVDKAITDMSWSSLVQMMSKHEVRANKNGLSIIPAKFKPRDQWVLSVPREDYTPTYRNQENVEAITIAIIDIDREGGLDAAKEVLKDFEYLVYSTHSYTANTPYKFRAVIRLQEAIPVENWPLAFACLVKQIDADKQCGNADRLYFLPAVSPKAGIAPYFEHHRGRVMGYEDILKLGGDNPAELLSKKIQEKKNRRHFAGNDNESLLSVTDQLMWTWDAMLHRNKELVDSFKADDSRHHFALRTIGREVGQFKERVNLSALFSFLYKAAALYGSKPMNRGNTPREIPEFVESAFRKYVPGENPLKGYEDINGMPLRRAIDRAIQEADVSSSTGKWVVDKHISFLDGTTRLPTGTEMRQLQRENMQNLVQEKDLGAYTLRALDTFLNSSYEFKADYFANFIVSSSDAYLTKYNATADKKQSIEALISIDFPAALAGKKGEEFARFIRPALRKACAKQFESSIKMAY
jgi:hypothetical protein